MLVPLNASLALSDSHPMDSSTQSPREQVEFWLSLIQTKSDINASRERPIKEMCDAIPLISQNGTSSELEEFLDFIFYVLREGEDEYDVEHFGIEMYKVFYHQAMPFFRELKSEPSRKNIKNQGEYYAVYRIMTLRYLYRRLIDSIFELPYSTGSDFAEKINIMIKFGFPVKPSNFKKFLRNCQEQDRNPIPFLALVSPLPNEGAKDCPVGLTEHSILQAVAEVFESVETKRSWFPPLLERMHKIVEIHPYHDFVHNMQKYYTEDFWKHELVAFGRVDKLLGIQTPVTVTA